MPGFQVVVVSGSSRPSGTMLHGMPPQSSPPLPAPEIEPPLPPATPPLPPAFAEPPDAPLPAVPAMLLEPPASPGEAPELSLQPRPVRVNTALKARAQG